MAPPPPPPPPADESELDARPEPDDEGDNAEQDAAAEPPARICATILDDSHPHYHGIPVYTARATNDKDYFVTSDSVSTRTPFWKGGGITFIIQEGDYHTVGGRTLLRGRDAVPIYTADISNHVPFSAATLTTYDSGQRHGTLTTTGVNLKKYKPMRFFPNRFTGHSPLFYVPGWPIRYLAFSENTGKKAAKMYSEIHSIVADPILFDRHIDCLATSDLLSFVNQHCAPNLQVPDGYDVVFGYSAHVGGDEFTGLTMADAVNIFPRDEPWTAPNFYLALDRIRLTVGAELADDDISDTRRSALENLKKKLRRGKMINILFFQPAWDTFYSPEIICNGINAMLHSQAKARATRGHSKIRSVLLLTSYDIQASPGSFYLNNSLTCRHTPRLGSYLQRFVDIQGPVYCGFFNDDPDTLAYETRRSDQHRNLFGAHFSTNPEPRTLPPPLAIPYVDQAYDADETVSVAETPFDYETTLLLSWTHDADNSASVLSLLETLGLVSSPRSMETPGYHAVAARCDDRAQRDCLEAALYLEDDEADSQFDRLLPIMVMPAELKFTETGHSLVLLYVGKNHDHILRALLAPLTRVYLDPQPDYDGNHVRTVGLQHPIATQVTALLAEHNTDSLAKGQEPVFWATTVVGVTHWLRPRPSGTAVHYDFPDQIIFLGLHDFHNKSIAKKVLSHFVPPEGLAVALNSAIFCKKAKTTAFSLRAIVPSVQKVLAKGPLCMTTGRYTVNVTPVHCRTQDYPVLGRKLLKPHVGGMKSLTNALQGAAGPSKTQKDAIARATNLTEASALLENLRLLCQAPRGPADRNVEARADSLDANSGRSPATVIDSQSVISPAVGPEQIPLPSSPPPGFPPYGNLLPRRGMELDDLYDADEEVPEQANPSPSKKRNRNDDPIIFPTSFIPFDKSDFDDNNAFDLACADFRGDALAILQAHSGGGGSSFLTETLTTEAGLKALYARVPYPNELNRLLVDLGLCTLPHSNDLSSAVSAIAKGAPLTNFPNGYFTFHHSPTGSPPEAEQAEPSRSFARVVKDGDTLVFHLFDPLDRPFLVGNLASEVCAIAQAIGSQVHAIPHSGPTDPKLAVDHDRAPFFEVLHAVGFVSDNPSLQVDATPYWNVPELWDQTVSLLLLARLQLGLDLTDLATLLTSNEEPSPETDRWAAVWTKALNLVYNAKPRAVGSNRRGAPPNKRLNKSQAAANSGDRGRD